MNQLFYKLINWYAGRYPFPHRGWKYFAWLLRRLKIDKKLYQKKIEPHLFIYVNAFDHIQQQILWYAKYDKEVAGFFKKIITPETIVVDAGANIGYFSVLAAGEKVKKVYAFEPVKATCRQLQDNIQLNGFTNVNVINKALSHAAGFVTIYESDNTNTGMSSLRKPENYSGRQEEIESISLDAFFSTNKDYKPMVVKIDTEGAEMDVLKGMVNCIDNYQPLLIIEVLHEHLKRFGSSVNEVYELLLNKGYKAWQIVDENTLRPLITPVESYGTVFSPVGYEFAEHIRLLN